jgi:peroxiredoxin/mono/diheme cytochrome c family protein
MPPLAARESEKAMSRRTVAIFSLVLATTAAAAVRSHRLDPDVSAPGEKTAETSLPAEPVRDFTLRDYRGKPHSLHDLAGRRVVVLAFLGSACPLAKLYGPRLAALAREFEPQGVAFLGINANAQDSLAELAAYARSCQLPFPLLKDADQSVANRLDAERTPEVLVLDQERRIRYRGRIDDQYAIGIKRSQPRRRDLAVALEELLAGRPISRPRTTAVGCRIGRAPRAQPQGEITYARQISRILQKRCVECHRPGEAAPFPLTDYKEAAGWAAMIREVIQEGRMPPWSAESRHGEFRNDPRLTEAEKRLIFQWIDNGCPEGDPADLPASASFVKGWRISQPDQVVFMAAKPHSVPADGQVEYQYFLADPGFKEDKLIQAVEVRPGNRAVVHHALVLVVPPGSDRPEPDSQGALIDYAPGMAPTLLPEGMALHVAAGSRFLFQLHYTPNGSVQKDLSYLGLVFADAAKVKKRVRGGAVVNPALDIRPGAADYRVTAEHRLTEDGLLLSMSPHMHLRGKSFRYEAVFPDGRRETLLDVPRYDFNWQLRYELTRPRLLPSGTRLRCLASYDNSANNPANPDPTRRVGWGDQTSDEMLIGFFAIAPAE